jgi:hypothetical protein
MPADPKPPNPLTRSPIRVPASPMPISAKLFGRDANTRMRRVRMTSGALLIVLSVSTGMSVRLRLFMTGNSAIGSLMCREMAAVVRSGALSREVMVSRGTVTGREEIDRTLRDRRVMATGGKAKKDSMARRNNRAVAVANIAETRESVSRARILAAVRIAAASPSRGKNGMRARSITPDATRVGRAILPGISRSVAMTSRVTTSRVISGAAKIGRTSRGLARIGTGTVVPEPIAHLEIAEPPGRIIHVANRDRSIAMPTGRVVTTRMTARFSPSVRRSVAVALIANGRPRSGVLRGRHARKNPASV